MSAANPMDSVEGQQYAEAVLANVKTGHESPDYLHDLMRHLNLCNPTFRRAFFRQLQKEIENNFKQR